MEVNQEGTLRVPLYVYDAFFAVFSDSPLDLYQIPQTFVNNNEKTTLFQRKRLYAELKK